MNLISKISARCSNARCRIDPRCFVHKEAAGIWPDDPDPVMQLEYMARAYAACGYDYVNTYGCDFCFPTGETQRNAHSVI